MHESSYTREAENTRARFNRARGSDGRRTKCRAGTNVISEYNQRDVIAGSFTRLRLSYSRARLSRDTLKFLDMRNIKCYKFGLSASHTDLSNKGGALLSPDMRKNGIFLLVAPLFFIIVQLADAARFDRTPPFSLMISHHRMLRGSFDRTPYANCPTFSRSSVSPLSLRTVCVSGVVIIFFNLAKSTRYSVMRD